MRAAILGFAAGVLWLQRQPSLPSEWVTVAIAAAAVCMLVSMRFLRLPRVRVAAYAAAGLAFGVAWAATAAQIRLSDALDPLWEGRDVQVTGVIASLPQPIDRGARFEFDVESKTPADAAIP